MAVNPKSAHVNDPILQPFLHPSFSATDYLNNVLPPLHISSTNQAAKPSQNLSLSELTAQTQSHITQLSAQTSRLSDTLTQLTDEILRSGSRLAYEVEVLRGEALSLQDALNETLQDDIQQFLPNGLPPPPVSKSNLESQDTATSTENGNAAPLDTSTAQISEAKGVPPALAHLRTLQQVRTRLHSVTQTFDSALSWPLPPSLLTSTSNPASSLISISAPTPPPASDASDPTNPAPSLESQGQAALQRLRQEIADLLDLGGQEGLAAAGARVEEIRRLAGLWKGTSEEKARARAVEGLEGMVRERRKKMEAVEGERGRERGVVAGLKEEEREARGKKEGSRGPGFLRRLREEIYLE